MIWLKSRLYLPVVPLPLSRLRLEDLDPEILVIRNDHSV